MTKTNKKSDVIPGDALFVPSSFFLLEQPATPEIASSLVFFSPKLPLSSELPPLKLFSSHFFFFFSHQPPSGSQKPPLFSKSLCQKKKNQQPKAPPSPLAAGPLHNRKNSLPGVTFWLLLQKHYLIL